MTSDHASSEPLRVLHFVTGGFSGATQVAVDLVRAAMQPGSATRPLLVLRRKLIYWHSEMEVEIMSVIETGDTKMTSSQAPWLHPHSEWNLQMVDCTLPDLADCQGKQIAELDLRARFGCSVVGIERQGYMIPLPTPDAVPLKIRSA